MSNKTDFSKVRINFVLYVCHDVDSGNVLALVRRRPVSLNSSRDKIQFNSEADPELTISEFWTTHRYNKLKNNSQEANNIQ